MLVMAIYLIIQRGIFRIGSTVEPACKAYVLSKENWPYKRADLQPGSVFTVSNHETHGPIDQTIKGKQYPW